MNVEEAQAAYRAAIGKAANEASYISTYSEGIIAVFAEDPRTVLEPLAREILGEIVRSAGNIESLRAIGLNGYDWENELLIAIQEESVKKVESQILEIQERSIDLDKTPSLVPAAFKPVQQDFEESVPVRKQNRRTK